MGAPTLAGSRWVDDENEQRDLTNLTAISCHGVFNNPV